MIDFSNKEEVVNKLNELKAKNLPHMTVEQFSELKPLFKRDIEKATEEEKKIISEELFKYYRSDKENICIFSDEFPVLSWGLHHGTAIDSNTGLSWECYHYFTINGERHRYDRTLQYHPDNYEIEKEI
jgi:hypothetical protein